MVGEEVLQNVEKQLTLFHLNKCWAEHLSHIAHVREGIHLVSFGGERPLDEFKKIVADAFRNMLQRIDNEVVKSFESVDITKNGIDMEKEGLKGPSSTWTYLINDNPFGGLLERLFKGLKKKISK